MGVVRRKLGAVKRRALSVGGSDDQSRDDAVDAQIDALRRRVQSLEAEVQENRELNRRIAELTDVVTELLVPLSDQDKAGVDAVLEKYRKSL